MTRMWVLGLLATGCGGDFTPPLSDDSGTMMMMDGMMEDSEVPLVCDPGRGVACTGIGGCAGGQLCLDDGSGFGECLCAGPTDAGVDTRREEDASSDTGADSSMPPVDAGRCPDDGNPCTLSRVTTCEVFNAPDGRTCNTIGACYGGVCCEGCMEGSTCRTGSELSACGIRGTACEDCEALAGECNVPTCTAATTSCQLARVADGTPCSSGVCRSGSCASCGGDGDLCCAGDSCSTGLTCESGRCRGCGGSGEACCGGLTCDGALVCSAGMCSPCGGRGQPCCGSSCGASLVCVGPAAGRTCQCGLPGQPCCSDTFCVRPWACSGSPGSRTCGT